MELYEFTGTIDEFNDMLNMSLINDRIRIIPISVYPLPKNGECRIFYCQEDIDN